MPELAWREAKRILGLVAEGKGPAGKKKDRSASTPSALTDCFLERHVEAKSKDRAYTLTYIGDLTGNHVNSASWRAYVTCDGMLE